MQEYVAEIIDRQTVPNPVKNDMYVAGQGSPVLKVRKDSPFFGHLYWTYSANPYPFTADFPVVAKTKEVEQHHDTKKK
jgi:hypothetical protein